MNDLKDKIKPIPRFGGRFWIAEDGSFLVDYKQGGKYIYPKHIDNSGYLHINLHNERYKRKNRTYRVHELVAEAFLGERLAGQVIDHIDRDKTNNHYKNLRYVSQSTNMRNSVRYGHIAVSLIKGDKSWDFKSMAAAKRFLMTATGNTSRYLQGKFYVHCKEIQGFKIIYADEIPELCPKRHQSIVQLSLFKEEDL